MISPDEVCFRSTLPAEYRRDMKHLEGLCDEAITVSELAAEWPAQVRAILTFNAPAVRDTVLAYRKAGWDVTRQGSVLSLDRRMFGDTSTAEIEELLASKYLRLAYQVTGGRSTTAYLDTEDKLVVEELIAELLRRGFSSESIQHMTPGEVLRYV